MTGRGEGPLCLRLARTLAGRGEAGEPDAPMAWDGREAVSIRGLDALAARIGETPRRLAVALDSALGALGARPLLVLAGAAIAMPATRLLLAPAAATATAAVLLAITGLTLILGLAGSLYGDHGDRERTLVFRALAAGLVLRLVLLAAVHATGGFPDEHYVYQPLAEDSAASWQTGGPSLLSGHPVAAGRALYLYLLSAVYLLTGPSMIVGRLFGGLVGLAAAVLAGEVARALAGRRAAAIGVLLLALHPEHALWSITLSRDALTTLVVLTALAVIARHRGRLLLGWILLLAIPVALLVLNAFVVAGALAATIVLLALGEAASGERTGAFRWLGPATALALATGALLLVGHRYGAFFTPERIDAVRCLGVGLEPDFLPGFRLESGLDLLLFLPLGAVFVLFAPFPWDAIHAHRAAYGILALGGLAVTLLGIVGLAATLRRRPGAAAPSVVFALLMLAALALLEGNSGILVRHRLPLTAVLTAGAAALLAGRRDPEAVR